MNVTELLDSLVSLPTLLLAILVYGFAPGFLLRLLVLVYDREDPRRAELIAELYDVPRLKRPFWVAEQVETAIFDGLGPRIRWALTGRVILRWKLRSGVRQNRLHPTSFWIPSEEDKDEIEPGVNTSSTSTPIHTRRPWRGHTTLSARSAARATRRTLSQASQPGTGTR